MAIVHSLATMVRITHCDMGRYVEGHPGQTAPITPPRGKPSVSAAKNKAATPEASGKLGAVFASSATMADEEQECSRSLS